MKLPNSICMNFAPFKTMKIKLTLALVLPLFLISIGRSEGLDSQQTIAAFFNAVKADKPGEASSVTFIKPGSEKLIEGRISRMVEASKAAAGTVEVVELKEVGTIARAVVKDTAKKADGKPDYDGILLLKREGKWKVVLGAAEVEDTPGVLTAAERRELSGLWDWQTETMKRLEGQ